MMEPHIAFQIEYSIGSGQYGWSPIGLRELTNEFEARKILEVNREANLHRDDKIRAQTRPCPIWTIDGTWTTYRSAATNYRLVKIIREVVDEDPNFNSGE